MKIIIPMTGMGRRFIEAGFNMPKPLIEIGGKRMIEHVIAMYPKETDFIFICNLRHLSFSPMESVLKSLAPSGEIVGIEKKVWDGPVPDILKIEPLVDDKEPVLVSYCDFSVEWDYEHFKKTMFDARYDGGIIAYRGFHPHHLGPTYYGYMRVDSNNLLLEIKEKECFTNNRMNEFAAAGSYYFRTGAIMKKYFREAVKRDLRTKGEFYASLPYNLMAADGLKTYVYEVSKFIQFGTPDDVRAYEYWFEYFKNKLKI